ncbi:alpha/beta fold hydrolase [Pseudarthrobacter sp. P1]|uniref:alpha/beta fold hydrolase n=1 Tax=Pseudarthrobacter sp. P1 TaxID=3418418 RepID=UPI003CF59CD4
MDVLTHETISLEVRQTGFDRLGPVVRSAVVGSGRRVHYIDEGSAEGTPLLFFGGAGTTVRAFGLMEFARSFREQLGIRVLSVERNGLGQTPFDPAVGFAEHAADVWSLLDSLGIGQVSIIAISGGGPYAARVAAAQPGRVRSLHLACAYSEPVADVGARFDAEQVAADPVAWWQFPAASPVHRIPGFDDAVVEEATRGVFARGRDVAPQGLAQAFELYSRTPLPDLSAATCPVFLYWGSEDALVPVVHMQRWRRALAAATRGRAVVERVYPGEGHDVQYRHWDQILADVAHLGQRIVLTHQGRATLQTPEDAALLLAAGATPGLAAWA